MLIAAVSILVYSCGPDDNEKEWGNTKVYMPQAAILNGGLNNNYPVPLNNNASTQNYSIDESTNTLRIFLGVYRSGLQKLEAFSVEVGVDHAATTSAAAAQSRGIELPAEVYSLPSTASVADGERETIFYLDVDLNKLASDYSGYAKNKLVLVVGISNPSKYELNENLSKTIVIIDGGTFLGAPAIVQGGTFDEGSEQYWTSQYLHSLPQNPSGIIDGRLVIDYGDVTTVRGEYVWYHEIELEAGKKYKYSCDVTFEGVSGADAGFRFFTIVTEHKPEEGITFNYDTETGDGKNFSFSSMFDAWTTFPSSGQATIPQFAKENKEIDGSTGEFTSTVNKGYLVLAMHAWLPSYPGRVTFDNIKIEEQ